MSDDVRRIGFRPDSPSGHHQRHLEFVPDFAEKSVLQVAGGGHSKAVRFKEHFHMCVVPGRSMRKLKVMLGCRSGLSTCWTTNGLPKHYHEHPVVKRNANEDEFPVTFIHGCSALLVV